MSDSHSVTMEIIAALRPMQTPEKLRVNEEVEGR
jgi:hypothetical protein